MIFRISGPYDVEFRIILTVRGSLLILFLSLAVACSNAGTEFQKTGGSANKNAGPPNNVPVVTAISHQQSNWDGSGNPLPTSVSCTVTDADGLNTITTVNIEQGHTEPDAGYVPYFYQLADDGVGDDAVAGDGIFTRTFAQSLAVNPLHYTNKAGHYWECTAKDDFLDKGVLRVP